MIQRVLRFVYKLFFGPRFERSLAWHNLGLMLIGMDVHPRSMEELGLDEARSYWYANSGGPWLRRFLRTLPVTPADSAIDLGCGKGGAILTMSRFPFRRVDGVDISPSIVDAARRNLARMRILKSTIFLGDAADFRNLDPYTYVYLYNPFPAPVVECVMRNLRDSLAAHPRPLTLIYCNPKHEECIVRNGFQAVQEFNEAMFPIRVYQPVQN